MLEVLSGTRATPSPAHSAIAASSVKLVGAVRRRVPVRGEQFRNGTLAASARATGRPGRPSPRRGRRRPPASAYRPAVPRQAPPGACPAPPAPPSIVAALTNGRAASCISTRPISWPASACSPASTEACRDAPPATGAHELCRRRFVCALIEKSLMLQVDNREHEVHAGVIAECAQRVGKHTACPKARILLGQPGAQGGTRTGAGRDDDRCRLHRAIRSIGWFIVSAYPRCGVRAMEE